MLTETTSAAQAELGLCAGRVADLKRTAAAEDIAPEEVRCRPVTRRNAFNVRNTQLKAGNSAADETPSGGENSKDFVSNGFKFRDSDHNNQAQEYLYMAFAENPFVSSYGIPVNAE